MFAIPRMIRNRDGLGVRLTPNSIAGKMIYVGSIYRSRTSYPPPLHRMQLLNVG